ncbi:MAG: ATP-binding protein [Gammaproteobacteria bacterium]|nr:ATP-binding protein [Gammaproteobacteria bacterium]
MILKLLQTLLVEFQAKYSTMADPVSRQGHFNHLPNKIDVAIGMRRVGKTYFLFQTIRDLLMKENIPWHRILYLNFEDDRLLPCSQKKLVALLEGFYQLYPDNHDHTCYFFLDEIQQVDDWPLVIRRFFDTKKIKIYLTGSSARLLSKEIASSLRGRSLSTEIWPYSFNEYLSAYHMTWDKKHLVSDKIQHKLQEYLRNYFIQGGFPETIGLPVDKQRQLLQDYVEVVLMRDIIERYNITNISLIKYLLSTLLKNIATGFSVHKFANDVKSQGLTGAKNTIHDYLSYIEDAYLVFCVPLFSESLRKTHSNPRKIYAIDTGLANAFSFSLQHNSGHLFENIVYLDFRRRGCKVYYYLTQERCEVDFLVEDPFGHRKLYQVVWDMSDPSTLAREERALRTAEKELGIPGEIITPEVYMQWVKLEKT